MPTNTITLTPEISEGIDRFIASQEEQQSRDEAANAALGDWLTGLGFLDPVECPPEVAAKSGCE